MELSFEIKLHTTWGLVLLGQDVVTSAMCKHQQQFGHDVNNLALVLIFNFLKNIGFPLSADVFQISQQRQARTLVATFGLLVCWLVRFLSS